ncbi:MAG TPA: TonB-dependent receptor, partial [Candidatus Kapabacteria bacterium]|nr:TonB-dependent receptor [Candidatus Kapabacteria bacterium]
KPTDSYKANENLVAGYLMIDIPFDLAGNKLRVITGARIESSKQKLMSLYPIASNNTDSTFVDESYLDILPSFNLIYQLTNTMNLRFSASQTLTRPSLREYAPFIFYDFYFQGDVAGNPNLKRSLIRNFDLRWEMFPNPGEVVSLSFFYKSFKDAIEESVIGTSSNYKRTFANANGLATNYGAEFELRKNLGFISDWTRYFSLNLNFALVNSDITVRQNNAEDRRTMWGQSPYSLNIGLFYFHPELGTSVNTSYNVAGKRIIQVADITRYPVSDPHVYEMPRNVIDLSISQTVFNTLDIKFVAKDILNEKITWKQMDNDVLSTKKGRSFSFGIGYKL